MESTKFPIVSDLIESVTGTIDNSANLLHYGSINTDTRTWTCRYPSCGGKAIYNRPADLHRHFTHYRENFFYRNAGCPRVQEGGFSGKKDRLRHESKHNPCINCEWDGCERVFSKVENMRNHMARIHLKRKPDSSLGIHQVSKEGVQTGDGKAISLMESAEEDQQTTSHFTRGNSNETSYSETSSSSVSVLADTIKDTSVVKFTNYLVQQVIETAAYTEIPHDLPSILPNVLRSFVARLGDGALNDAQRYAMIFIDKNRGMIAKALEKRFQVINAAEMGEQIEEAARYQEVWRSTAPVISADEKISLWAMGSPELYEPISDMVDNEWDLDVDDTEAVFDSYAFAWLVARLRREFTMISPMEDTIKLISDAILDKHENSVLGRKSSNVPYMVSLSLDWDLRLFVDSQSQGIRSRGWKGDDVICLERLEHAITVTGSLCDAQALTCGEYLDLVWPSVGREVLKLVLQLHHSSPKKSQSYFTDGTEAQGYQTVNLVYLKLTGNRYAITEITEVLTWLAATFRQHPIADGLCCSRAFIQSEFDLMLAQVDSRSSVLQNVPQMKRYRITFLTERSPKAGLNQCWHDMFNAPVLTIGYPIQRRPRYGSGLEITAALINTLLQEPQVNVLDNRLYIKGFSAMLIPTGRKGDLLMWHYIYNKTGEYLDFLETEVEHAGVADLEDIMRCRNIVGWCPRARFNAGAPWKEGHKIEASNLDAPTLTFGFKAFTLSGGYMGVNLAFPIAIGVKDPPAWVSPKFKATEDRIDHMSKNYVLLWDTIDLRGWLVDGVSALLHLIRAALEMKRQRFSRTFRLDMGTILEPHEVTPEVVYPEAAEEFFLCDDYWNLGLTIFRGVTVRTNEEVTKQISGENERVMEMNNKQTRTATIIEDEFLRLWTILAHLTFRVKQLQKKNVDGKELRWQDLKRDPYIMGWDFKDIAIPATDVEPKMALLLSTTKSWVKLAETIGTVNLFGEGFGELIEPDSNTCANWKTVPLHMYYLATGQYVIDSIVTNKKYTELSHQIRPLAPASKSCPCKAPHLHTINTQNRLQKTRRPAEVLTKSLTNPKGAIIFGVEEPSRFPFALSKDTGEASKQAGDLSTIGEPSSSSSNSTQQTSISSSNILFDYESKARDKGKGRAQNSHGCY